MKKSILALAAIATLAAAGAVSAQSSVSVYGRLDLSVGSEKDDIANTSVTQIESGLLSTSRIGFRGTEDLGGGLKAMFQLESELNADTGGGLAGFGRQSWLGLSGGFGTIKLGRTDTVYDDIRDLSVSSSVFDSAFTPTGDVDDVGVGGYASRGSNMIRYDSPAFSGFTAALSYELDEQASPVNQNVVSYNLRYKLDKLNVGFARQERNNKAVAANDRTYNALAAAYNFGVASVSVGFETAKNEADVKDRLFSLGVNVPVEKFNFSFGYSRENSKVAGVKDDKASGFGLGMTYSMSKRTRLYAGYKSVTEKDAAGIKTADDTLYAVGIRHDF